ncbi:MAG: hypothetical protein J5511_05450 [Bacilli bacterium]|nr:hypothetical protein [Bacilli bacterium]
MDKDNSFVLQQAVQAFAIAMIGMTLFPVLQLIMGIIAYNKVEAVRKWTTKDSEVIFVNIARPVAIFNVVVGSLVVLGLSIYASVMLILFARTLG